MRLRSFTAPTLQEVRDKIRQELGEDASIANTLDLGKDGFQIVCAIDDDDDAGYENHGNEHEGLEELEENSEEDHENYDDAEGPKDLTFQTRIAQALHWHEMGDDLIQRLLNKSFNNNNDFASAPEALSHALTRPKGSLSLDSLVSAGQLVILVGPPGCGKTSFCARLALEAHKKEIAPALVAQDTSRVAGIEQLQKYAERIGAELCLPQMNRMAYLSQIAKLLKNKFFVVIDTAGVNPFSREEFAELTKITAPNQAIKILVLPSYYGLPQMRRIAGSFSSLQLSGIVATGLDIDPRLGSLIYAGNLLMLPIIAASARPNVSAPLEDASGSWLSKWIFNTTPNKAFETPLPKNAGSTNDAQADTSSVSNTLSPVNRINIDADLSKFIVVASGKGGVGKTWLSVTISQSLALRKQKVLLFDGDLGMANIDIQLGLTPHVDLAKVLQNGSPIKDAIINYQPGNFDVIAGRSGSGKLANLSSEKIAKTIIQLAEISKNYDHVIVDLGAGIDKASEMFSQLSALVILVTTEDPTSVADSYAFMKYLFSRKADANLYMVVNSADNFSSGHQTFETIQEAARQFLYTQIGLAGIIEKDSSVVDAIRHQMPIMTRSPIAKASKQVLDIAKSIRKNEFTKVTLES